MAQDFFILTGEETSHEYLLCVVAEEMGNKIKEKLKNNISNLGIDELIELSNELKTLIEISENNRQLKNQAILEKNENKPTIH